MSARSTSLSSRQAGWRSSLALGLLLLGIVGCAGPATTDSPVAVHPTLLTAESRYIAGLTWADNDTLALLDDTLAADGRSLPTRFLLMAVDGGGGTTELVLGPTDSR